MNEGKLKAPDHYQVKKEAAKIVANAKGVKYQEAFDSIPDEMISDMNHRGLADRILSGEISEESLEFLQARKAEVENALKSEIPDKGEKDMLKKLLKETDKKIKKLIK